MKYKKTFQTLGSSRHGHRDDCTDPELSPLASCPCPFSPFSIFSFIHLCMRMIQHMYENRRKIWANQFSSSTTHIPGLNLGHRDGQQAPLPTDYLARATASHPVLLDIYAQSLLSAIDQRQQIINFLRKTQQKPNFLEKSETIKNTWSLGGHFQYKP